MNCLSLLQRRLSMATFLERANRPVVQSHTPACHFRAAIATLYTDGSQFTRKSIPIRGAADKIDHREPDRRILCSLKAFNLARNSISLVSGASLPCATGWRIPSLRQKKMHNSKSLKASFHLSAELKQALQSESLTVYPGYMESSRERDVN